MQVNRRMTEIFISLLLVFLGAAALGAETPLIILLGVVGLYWFFQRMDKMRSTFDDNHYDFEPDEIEEQPERERIYRHALASVKQAGLDPDQVRVLVTDIGVIAYKGDDDPVVYRTRSVPDDVDYVQPFVQLRLPTKAVGRIRFEIVDSYGRSLFIREENRQLTSGRNLVTFDRRLAVHDEQAMHTGWELRVSADDVLLASHELTWEETTTRVVRRHISEDGEISNELRATLSDNRLEKMSLDDLLSYQDDESDAQQRRR